MVDVAAAYGLVLDEWQENVLEAAMGERADGKWAAPRVGVSVPRQNGKGALIEARELAGLLVFGEQSIVHSAHEQKTARVGFDRIKSYFENYDELGKKVKRIGEALGREYIELTTGQMLRFPARSKGAIRGFSVDLLILDEAQEFSDYQMQAVMPTMAARENPQMWLLGTPPNDMNDGEVFKRWREAGHKREDRRLAWCEWSAPVDCDLDDRQAWAAANPALGIRIAYETVEDERAALDDAGFARERLGMWDEARTREVIDSKTWRECADPDSRAVFDLALGVDVSPDRTSASVSLAGRRGDDVWHIELVEQRAGTGWVVPYLVKLLELNEVRAVVVDGGSPAASLLDELSRAKVRPLVTGAKDMAMACARLYDGAMQGTLVHTDQPQMNAALAGAKKRQMLNREAWGWSRKNSTVDITPLVSATLALFGAQAMKTKRPLVGAKSSSRGVMVL